MQVLDAFIFCRRTPTHNIAVEVLQERMIDLSEQVAQTSSQMNQMMQMMQTVLIQQRRSKGHLENIEVTEIPGEN